MLYPPLGSFLAWTLHFWQYGWERMWKSLKENLTSFLIHAKNINYWSGGHVLKIVDRTAKIVFLTSSCVPVHLLSKTHKVSAFWLQEKATKTTFLVQRPNKKLNENLVKLLPKVSMFIVQVYITTYYICSIPTVNCLT